ncbi:F-actin-capping protein [Apophysomyces sp. BC1021]|nr:F-actin-capping protein [Apophysomyces sp. BC1021]
MEITVEEKVAIASSFLLVSPPGEVNDVFNDVRTLVDNDEALQDGILKALEQYNTEQLITVTPPGLDYEIASDLDDHETEQTIEDLSGIEIDIIRTAVDTEIQAYVADHYPNGVCTVYGLSGEEIAICIVDNKNGRWLSTWTYNKQTGKLKGASKVNIHYYEEGNIQLNSDKEFESTITSDEGAQQIATALLKDITAFDKRYHNAMNNSYNELAENTFKGLRRALPLTRHKLDWNKILNYKIGSELTQK